MDYTLLIFLGLFGALLLPSLFDGGDDVADDGGVDDVPEDSTQEVTLPAHGEDAALMIAYEPGQYELEPSYQNDERNSITLTINDDDTFEMVTDTYFLETGNVEAHYRDTVSGKISQDGLFVGEVQKEYGHNDEDLKESSHWYYVGKIYADGYVQFASAQEPVNSLDDPAIDMSDSGTINMADLDGDETNVSVEDIMRAVNRSAFIEF